MHKDLKGLKVTNEWQDDGTGILHQVAQFPIDQVGYSSIQGAHTLSTHAKPRDKGTDCRAGRPICPSKTPHPLLREAVEKCGR